MFIIIFKLRPNKYYSDVLIIVNVILLINSPLVTCLTSYECNNVIFYFSSIISVWEYK